MKRSLIVFGIMITGSAFFSSCNKNLKDDVKDLQQQVEELKKRSSELRDQAKAAGNAVGTDEPITATTTFTDNSNNTRTIKGTYQFKSGNSGTQYMVNNENGTYDIYIERFGDVEWEEGAFASFTYNPTTKEITQKSGGHYWDDHDNYANHMWYNPGIYASGCTVTITVNSLNVNTGEIAMSFSASATGEYTQAIYNMYDYYVPNPGQPASTNFSFTGKLKLFTRN